MNTVEDSPIIQEKIYKQDSAKDNFIIYCYIKQIKRNYGKNQNLIIKLQII